MPRFCQCHRIKRTFNDVQQYFVRQGLYMFNHPTVMLGSAGRRRALFTSGADVVEAHDRDARPVRRWCRCRAGCQFAIAATRTMFFALDAIGGRPWFSAASAAQVKMSTWPPRRVYRQIIHVKRPTYTYIPLLHTSTGRPVKISVYSYQNYVGIRSENHLNRYLHFAITI